MRECGDAPQVVHRAHLAEHFSQALLRGIVRDVSEEHVVRRTAATHLGLGSHEIRARPHSENARKGNESNSSYACFRRRIFLRNCLREPSRLFPRALVSRRRDALGGALEFPCRGVGRVARELRKRHRGPWVPVRTRMASWERFANSPETTGAAAAGLANATSAIVPAIARTAAGTATAATSAGVGIAETDTVTAPGGDARGTRGGKIANTHETEMEAATATAADTATTTAIETTRCVTDRAPRRRLDRLP